ncbi:MAG: ABC transporter permease [Balneola sp.]|nr:MAG: ABC transporter permease [Balneola sp.]
MKFDLEAKIAAWKKKLKANRVFDDGDIKEYEEHLRDEVNFLVDNGMDEEEAFYKSVKNFGEPKNLAREFKSVVQIKNPVKRRLHLAELSFLSLLPNYLKLSARSMLRNKFYTTINIISVALGLIVSVIILQYYFYETNQDTYVEDYDRVYRINAGRVNDSGERTLKTAINFPALAGTLREESESVEEVAQLVGNGTIFRKDEAVFQENGIFYTDGSSVLCVFSVELIIGSSEDLDKPNTIFLSEELAEKYFNNENAIGQAIEVIDVVGNWELFEVKGVYKEFPEISHIQPTALLNNTDIVQKLVDSGSFGPIPYDDIVWRLRNNYTYAKLKPENNAGLLEEELNAIIDRYRAGFDARQGINTILWHQPISTIHTTPDILNEPKQVADTQSLKFIFWIGIAALLIGWINYVNLSTAQSIKRAKEVGIRKVMGSSKSQLIIQFILESILVNLIAIFISIGLLMVLSQRFEDLIGLNVFDYVLEFKPYWAAFLMALFIGILFSGFYPALIFSRFKPISTLKGAFKNSKSGIALRKSLVLLQFSLSLFLIICIYVVFNQIHYIKNLDKGLDLENTYVINAPTFVEGNSLSRFEVFKRDLEAIPGISNVTNSSIIPGNSALPSMMAEKLVKEANEERIRLNYARADHAYFDHYKITLSEGRYFEEERGTEDQAVVVNEKALELLGFNSVSDAVNKRIVTSIGDTLEIIGVTQNYAQQSMQMEYIPLMLQLPVESGYIAGMGATSLKIDSGNLSGITEQIEGVFNTHFPGDIFNGFFLEDQFNQAYALEDRFQRIFGGFTIISILITILGLIGLSSYMSRQRKKEIGIRKVLGSSEIQIVKLLLNDYFKLIIFSCVLSIPVAIWWFKVWLDKFPFKYAPGVLAFLIPITILLAITVISVSKQSIQAAIVNPVNSLKED